VNVVPLELPSLRERAEDIPELARYFLEGSCARHQRAGLMLSASILDRFAAYSRPGNIRELRNTIERIVVLAPGTEVGISDLPPCLQSDTAASLARIGLVLPSKGVSLREIEKAVRREALKKITGTDLGPHATWALHGISSTIECANTGCMRRQ
jgi:DNA-binding NtrC family response regulator